MKTIGIVAEGPNDYEMLRMLIDEILGEENRYQSIQPQPNVNGEFGNGWKGVWKWCEQNREHLKDYFYAITPKLDLLVVHMDVDVARCEKELHCGCLEVQCSEVDKKHPLTCDTIKVGACPIVLPCRCHDDTPADYAEHLRRFLDRLIGDQNNLPICYCLPCDSMDTWIIAAYDETDNCETIHSPWENVVARSKNYHGIRIKNRPNKNNSTYRELIPKVCENWETVKKLCPQAMEFSDELSTYLE